MNRFRSGMVPLFALLVLVGCNSEPTENLRDGPAELVASPTQLFIELGQTKAVEVGAVDAQGNPLDFNYEVTDAGTGITVRRDSSYLPIFVDDTTLRAPETGPQFRFIVEGTAYTATSFTVSAGGLDIEIPVQVVPQQGFGGTFDNPTPALGDTITLTAAPGTAFTETAELRLPGVPDTIPLHPIIVARGENGSSLSFLAPPNVNGPIIITEVTSASAPDLVFSPATQTALQTPLIDTVDVTYSAAAPALGDVVTVTIPEPLIKVSTPLDIQFDGTLQGPAGGAANVTPAPDSSSFTFEAPANAVGVGTVVNFVFPGGYEIALPTRTGITSTTVFEPTVDATFSNETPDAFETVTITAPAGFFFSADTLSVTIGGNAALVQAVAPDGSTADVLPFPGSTGVAEIAGVSPTGFPQFIYTMNTINSITVGQALQGTESPETAPALTIPTAGNTVTITDGGGYAGDFLGFHARWYLIEIAAPTTLSFTLDWPSDEDLGLYITTDPLDAAGIVGVADASGEGPTGHPETSGPVVLAPGTYYAAVLNFSATNPAFFDIEISNP